MCLCFRLWGLISKGFTGHINLNRLGMNVICFLHSVSSSSPPFPSLSLPLIYTGASFLRHRAIDAEGEWRGGRRIEYGVTNVILQYGISQYRMPLLSFLNRRVSSPTDSLPTSKNFYSQPVYNFTGAKSPGIASSVKSFGLT